MSSFLRRLWRLLRAPLWLAVGFAAGFLVPYVAYLDHQVRARFDDLSWQIPSRVLARPLALERGQPISAELIELELAAARYRRDERAALPGTYVRDGARFVVYRRAFVGLDGKHGARRFAIDLAGTRIGALIDATTGAAIATEQIDPARIATLYGTTQEERRVVQLEQLPTLLVAGLQAVEDRSFKHHHGIDLTAILRAAWANLSAGRVVQGGSTLTQQLVRNLYLDRSQNALRKINEALLALIIEYRYDKRRILEAYVNEIFLGQQGGQAIHGFAAASEFWFGRDVATLGPAEIALLVGMVQGPSWYDPRRAPQRALERRNRVLGQFAETGLIDAKLLASSRAQPLGVVATGALPRNRFPAFLDLVRAQLARDFPETGIDAAGLTIHTTLAPSSQLVAEDALKRTLETLGPSQQALEAALVVTGARDGEVEVLVGGREADAQGFNRALDARRPIGSLVKPFVFLVALAQPQRHSWASLIDDAPVSLPQRDGTRWTPKNADGEEHGTVNLADVLANSWNLATVQLGLRLGVDAVRGLLQSLAPDRTINPNPSLLLGAVELSPLDVAQLYQYFAADGHALPLRAVRGVVDKAGRTLSRYGTKAGAGDYVTAARLVNWGMQQVVERGTARAIGVAGLGDRHIAGKTGTSDTQRDAWFAGFDGSRLGVVWIGRDDNKPTALYGSTGALRVWIDLFKRLPGQDLVIPEDGIETVWIDPSTGQRSDQSCRSARRVPFAAGYAPREWRECAGSEGRRRDE
ncbi:MAG TPA: penicillin-binding protein 1B [Dokdonella sp.]|uniref:penicillin-binding protein 1B n=1 Tax=Dokdonella sp. TaxID=2291710 RepID=UPI0025BEE955|nr:penicillin-binding protein 1B [Dokdonella sp.]HNR91186.1 penicillin-binding protein 1B [Dokdonella sp.]